MANQKSIEAVAELTGKIKKAKAIVFVDYQGIKVADDTKLRKTMREAKLEYIVAKNRLFKLALKDAGIEANFDEVLEGTTSFAISYDDLIAPAKAAFEFGKGKQIFKIKAGLLEGKRIEAADVEALAVLPPKEVLIARLLGSMQSSLTGFVIALDAIAKKKEAN